MLLLPETMNMVMHEINQKSQKSVYKRDPEAWAADVLGKRWWSKQQEIAWDYIHGTRTATKSANGTGKVVTPDTPLPTPTGWIDAGQVVVGDELFDERGQVTRVTGVSEVWEPDYYRVTFDDGSYVDAHANHEWVVHDVIKRTPKQRVSVTDWRDEWDTLTTKTTAQMLEAGVTYNSATKRWRIPIAQPLQLPEADLVLDPYLLGFWLGDGTARSPHITIGKAKEGLLDYLNHRGIPHSARWDGAKNAYSVYVPSLRQPLLDMGLMGNKHIPVEYLRASETQRRELLAGIMDADGFIMGAADVGIDLTNRELAGDLYELVTTLGGKVRRNEGVAAYTKGGIRHVTGTRYRMNWRPLENPFRVRETLWRDTVTQRSRHTLRSIVSIEPVEGDASYCIEVDSPSHLYLAGKGMVPTHNSILVSDLVCHWVSVHEPGEVIAILSAPTLSQINLVLFAYIKENYGLARARQLALPGRINESLEWKAETPSGVATLAVGRKPQDQDIVGSFQGVRRSTGTAVFIDEAGSVPRDLFTAAEAVTTGGGNHKIVMIGNPDNGRGSAFYDLWDKPENKKFWNLHTISAFDLPTFTGEIVYDDPEKQEFMLKSGMQTPEKVESWRAMWGEDSARWKSKVLGEFPDDSDNSFFSQEAINKALDTEIPEDPTEPLKLGVDIALSGQDETVIYGCRGGRLRKMHSIDKMNSFDGADEIHQFAVSVDAAELRIDASGTGEGVHSRLLNDPKYRLANYTLIGIKGGERSPDNSRWAQMRAWQYDNFRAKMQLGQIDLDVQDKDLYEQLIEQTARFNNRGAIQITPKDEMRKAGLHSPDELDAAIYASTDLEELGHGPKPGTKLYQKPFDVLDQVPAYIHLMDAI